MLVAVGVGNSPTTNCKTGGSVGFDPGEYALAQVTALNSPSANYITLSSAPLGGASDGSLNTRLSSSSVDSGSSWCKIQALKVPRFNNVTISSGASVSVTPYAHSSGTGGIIAFKVSGTLNLQGEIVVKGRGYQGGKMYSGSAVGRGQSMAGVDFTVAPPNSWDPNGQGGGRAATTDGGGGGAASYWLDNTRGGAGSGGSSSSASGGEAGTPVACTNASDGCLIMGGGGSSGYSSCTNMYGGSGGGGVFIQAATITGNGTIALGASTPATTCSKGAGGGAGGTLILRSHGILGSINISNSGSNGANSSTQAGGGGGGGVISVKACPFSTPVSTNASASTGGTGSGGGTHSNGYPGSSGEIMVDYTGCPNTP